MTRDGYVGVKVNYLCGSHQLIGNIFAVLFGFLENVEPFLIFLISCMDAVGLLVLIPDTSATATYGFHRRSFY